jgi:hypothetical protein
MKRAALSMRPCFPVQVSLPALELPKDYVGSLSNGKRSFMGRGVKSSDIPQVKCLLIKSTTIGPENIRHNQLNRFAIDCRDRFTSIYPGLRQS